ncbi:MAG: glycoside hydrolase family protein [Saccharofermentanales bacterium]
MPMIMRWKHVYKKVKNPDQRFALVLVLILCLSFSACKADINEGSSSITESREASSTMGSEEASSITESVEASSTTGSEGASSTMESEETSSIIESGNISSVTSGAKIDTGAVFTTDTHRKFSLDNPSGTPQFTSAQIAAQKQEGLRIIKEITSAANDLSVTRYIIAPGNYGFAQTFAVNGATSGFLLQNIVRPDSNPFTIVANGVTFWFNTMGPPTPTWGRALHINKCENIIIDGLTIDNYTRNSMEGKLTKIDSANNRIEVTLLPGSFSDEAKILAYNQTTGNQCRIIPIKPDGDFISSLYNINATWGPEYLWLNNITKSGEGRYWLNFRNTGLLNTIFTKNWLDAYGSDGTLEIGDGISTIYGYMGALVLDNSKQITLKNTNCYVQGNISETGGYGNHQYINVHLSSRPGTNQILGGYCQMAEGMRVGSTYDDCYFGLSTDDAVNIHGFWGIAQSVSGNVLVMDRMPSGVSAGDEVEFYNTNNGELFATYTVNSIAGGTNWSTDINGNRRNVSITFTSAPDASVVSSNQIYWARYPSAECADWTIRNTTFDNNYQRILIQSGPGVFENNIIKNMGSELSLVSNFASYEGGFIHNIRIRNNVFLNSATHPKGTVIHIDFTTRSSQTQWIHDISIENNVIEGSGGQAITVTNARDITIKGNIIINPLRYTAVSSPSMGMVRTAFAAGNTSSLDVENNYLLEASLYTAGERFIDHSDSNIYNKAFVDSQNKVKAMAYSGYANKTYSALDIFKLVLAEAKKIG